MQLQVKQAVNRKNRYSKGEKLFQMQFETRQRVNKRQSKVVPGIGAAQEKTLTQHRQLYRQRRDQGVTRCAKGECQRLTLQDATQKGCQQRGDENKEKQSDRRGRNQFWLRDCDRLLLLQVAQTPRSLKVIRSLNAQRRAVSVQKKTRLLVPQNLSEKGVSDSLRHRAP